MQWSKQRTDAVNQEKGQVMMPRVRVAFLPFSLSLKHARTHKIPLPFSSRSRGPIDFGLLEVFRNVMLTHEKHRGTHTVTKFSLSGHDCLNVEAPSEH